MISSAIPPGPGSDFAGYRFPWKISEGPVAFAAVLRGARLGRAPGCGKRSLCACFRDSEAGRLNCYGRRGIVEGWG